MQDKEDIVSMQKATRLWLSSLISAFLSGVSGVLAVNFIDPSNFNLENPDKLIKAAVAFGIVGVVNFLKDKPLPPGDDNSVSPRVGMLLLPLLLVLSQACTAARPPVILQPPSEEQVQQVRAMSVRLADAVKALGALVDSAQMATSQAYRSGIVSLEVRDEVNGLVIALEPKALAFIEAATQATSEPSLRASVELFLKAADALVSALDSGPPSMKATASKLRSGLRLLHEYVGGDK